MTSHTTKSTPSEGRASPRSTVIKEGPSSNTGVKNTRVYPLQTAGKGTFEWGAKIAQIWVHKCTVSAGKDYFHRVGMVPIS